MNRKGTHFCNLLPPPWQIIGSKRYNFLFQFFRGNFFFNFLRVVNCCESSFSLSLYLFLSFSLSTLPSPFFLLCNIPLRFMRSKCHVNPHIIRNEKENKEKVDATKRGGILLQKFFFHKERKLLLIYLSFFVTMGQNIKMRGCRLGWNFFLLLLNHFLPCFLFPIHFPIFFQENFFCPNQSSTFCPQKSHKVSRKEQEGNFVAHYTSSSKEERKEAEKSRKRAFPLWGWLDQISEKKFKWYITVILWKFDISSKTDLCEESQDESFIKTSVHLHYIFLHPPMWSLIPGSSTKFWIYWFTTQNFDIKFSPSGFESNDIFTRTRLFWQRRLSNFSISSTGKRDWNDRSVIGRRWGSSIKIWWAFSSSFQSLHSISFSFSYFLSVTSYEFNFEEVFIQWHKKKKKNFLSLFKSSTLFLFSWNFTLFLDEILK